MSGGPLVDGELDPGRSVFVFICGKKGTGKTELAKTLVRSYPYDRLVVDVTHDIDDLDPPNSAHPEWENIDELPVRFPGPDDDHPRRRSLRYLPDPGAPTYEDDLDRAIGLAFYNPRRRTLCFLDESKEAFAAGKTGPHGRRALRQGRHRNLTLIMADPRPVGVDPLCILQADYTYTFDLPHPLDQDRVAACIGWPPKDFAARCNALGEHEYLRYEALTKELTHWPPLPLHTGGDPFRSGPR